jgi:hypothetical protein
VVGGYAYIPLKWLSACLLVTGFSKADLKKQLLIAMQGPRELKIGDNCAQNCDALGK